MRPRRPKPTRNSAASTEDSASGDRLQKVLAAAGLGSRRKCEELITQGRVEIDRQVVSELGAKVNPLTQEVRVDGEVLRKPKAQYFVVNKPEGVLSTSYDQQQRARVIDLVKTNERLFTVGRLDQFSEGLILVTNDGELANRLTHPRYGAEKTYIVLAAGEVSPETLLKLKKGIHLAEGVARVASLKIRKAMRHSTELELVLQEGKNRELRRMLAAVGHKVMKLKRVQIGPLKLGELPVGAHRLLTRNELEELEAYAYGSRPKKPKREEGQSGPLSAQGKYGTAKKPAAVDRDDFDDEDSGTSGPVLVNEFSHIDERSLRKEGYQARAGAIIPYDEDDAPPTEQKPSAKRERPEQRGGKPAAPRKFAKRAGRSEAPRKFAKSAGHSETPRKFAKKSARPAERSEKPRSFGSQKLGGPGGKSAAPRKFAKKFAKRKDRS